MFFVVRCEREAPKGRGRLREPPSAAGFHGAKLLPFYITFAAAALLPFYAKTRPLLPYPHPMRNGGPHASCGLGTRVTTAYGQAILTKRAS